MIGSTNLKNWENFEIFHRSKLKKIKGKAKLSLASASLRGASAYKIILSTTATFLIALLMPFSDLKKGKHKSFLEKQHAGTHANIKKKPYWVSLIAKILLPLVGHVLNFKRKKLIT